MKRRIAIRCLLLTVVLVAGVLISVNAQRGYRGDNSRDYARVYRGGYSRAYGSNYRTYSYRLAIVRW